MCIEDHIATFVPDPLIGPDDDVLGETFVGMADNYDESLIKTAHEAADELGIDLRDGVYLQITGPTFESTAEARMYVAMGADAVGMSTACETIALRQMGVKVLGFSCMTDYCPNVTNDAASHDEVLEAAEKVSDTFVTLMKGVIVKIGKN